MAQADLYVVFDHVQFKKRYFENRNRMVSPDGEIFFLTVPVISKGRFTQAIRNVEIDNSQRWKEKFLGRLKQYYHQARFFSRYYEELTVLLGSRTFTHLIDLNMELIAFFRKNLLISCPMVFSSTLGVEAYTGSDLILQICRTQKADTYLCGASGKDYLKTDAFVTEKIDIQWLAYTPPEYAQLCARYAPNLSTLDLLFNHGEKSLGILQKKLIGD